jgi:hypothetical protein
VFIAIIGDGRDKSAHMGVRMNLLFTIIGPYGLSDPLSPLSPRLLTYKQFLQPWAMTLVVHPASIENVL